MGDTERVRHQRQEIAKLLELVRRKNRELDALHFVWCDGACGSGTHRHGGELTQEIVDEAVRNTERLERRWDAMQAKASDALDAAEDREVVVQRELGEAIRADMLSESLTDAEYAAVLAEPRPDLEAAMRQGIAEADAAREDADRARGAGWKKLAGVRIK